MDIPEVNAVFDSLNDLNVKLKPWSFVYFHGHLQDMFDMLDLSPGDLVQCSIPLNEYPLGVTKVKVRDVDALCYIWTCSAMWRHGLIVSLKDSKESHEYAFKAMQDKRFSI